MMRIVMEDGTEYKDWVKVMESGKKIKRFEVDFISLGKYWDSVPKFVFEGYEKYFFQKFGVIGIGMKSGVRRVDEFRGFQVGVLKSGVWFIIEVDFSMKSIVVFTRFDEQVTTNAIVEGECNGKC